MNDDVDIDTEQRLTDNQLADHLPAVIVPAAVGLAAPLPEAALIPGLITNEGERASWRYVDFCT